MKKNLSEILVSPVGMRFTTKIVAAAFACVLSFGSANAVVVGGAVTGGEAKTQGGMFAELEIPFMSPVTSSSDVGDDTFQTPNLYAFDEEQNINLSSNLNVDVGPNNPMGTTILAGVLVASHYVFFDPENRTTMTGYVDFDAPIVGVMTSLSNLIASDVLQHNSVNYLAPDYRGLESNRDSISITWALIAGDNKRLEVDWRARTPGDYVRVFTEFSVGAPPSTVPVPAALPLFGTGLALLGFLGWRKKRRAS